MLRDQCFKMVNYDLANVLLDPSVEDAAKKVAPIVGVY